MKETFNIFKNLEKKPAYILDLESKRDHIKSSGIENFEKWSNKTFTEKVALLDSLGGLSFKKPEEIITGKESGDSYYSDSLLDSYFDCFMRTIHFPNYQEQSEKLYPTDSKQSFSNKNDWVYVDHKYPEEFFNLGEDVLLFFERKDPELGDIILKKVDVLKKYGCKDTADWYNKDVKEKKKILIEGNFDGFIPLIEKGTILWSKEKYEKYLDSCYFQTIHEISTLMYQKNKWIDLYNKPASFYIANENKYIEDRNIQLENRLAELDKELLDYKKMVNTKIEAAQKKADEKINTLIEKTLADIPEKDREEARHLLSLLVNKKL